MGGTAVSTDETPTIFSPAFSAKAFSPAFFAKRLLDISMPITAAMPVYKDKDEKRPRIWKSKWYLE
jgi:hypothetical protein